MLLTIELDVADLAKILLEEGVPRNIANNLDKVTITIEYYDPIMERDAWDIIKLVKDIPTVRHLKTHNLSYFSVGNIAIFKNLHVLGLIGLSI